MVPTVSIVFLKFVRSAKNVKMAVTGATNLPASMLHEMIAPAESDPAKTSRTPVNTNTTVIIWVRVELIFVTARFAI